MLRNVPRRCHTGFWLCFRRALLTGWRTSLPAPPPDPQNEAILHRYANEDVAVGSWLVGLDVEYDNQRRLCCDTEWKCTGQVGLQAGGARCALPIMAVLSFFLRLMLGSRNK